MSRFIHGTHLEAAQKHLQAAMHVWSQAQVPEHRSPRAFITISRQAGAGAIDYAHELANQLNSTGSSDWSVWDRELVEKVSSESGIAQQLIEMIPNKMPNWLDDLLRGFFTSEKPPDALERRAYEQIVITVRALAAAGHAIIVGRGGAFITQELPGSIHLRMVAPLPYRVHRTAERNHLTPKEAAASVAHDDRRRAEFYRRYWPLRTTSPETYDITLNAARLSTQEMIQMILPLVRIRERHPSPASETVVS